MSDPTDREWLRVMAGDVTTFEYRRGGIRLLPYRARIEFRLIPPKKRKPLPVFAFDSLHIRRLLGRTVLILTISLIVLMGAASALYIHKGNLEIENNSKDADIDKLKATLNAAHQNAKQDVEQLQTQINTLESTRKSEVDIEVARQLAAILASRNALTRDKAAFTTKAQTVPPAAQVQTTDQQVATVTAVPKVEVEKPAEPPKTLALAARPVELRLPETAKRSESAILSKDRLGLATINKNTVTTIAGNELRVGDILPTGERILEIHQNGEILTDKRAILVLP